MKALVHLSINIFPIIMLIIILGNNHEKTKESKASCYFERLTMLTLLNMAVDVIGNLVVQTAAVTPEPVLWFFFVSRLLASAGMAAEWLCYAANRLYGDGEKRWIEYVSWFARGMFVASVLGILFVPWRMLAYFGTGRITPQMVNCYRIVSAENVILILSSIGMAFYAYRHSETQEKRRECLYMVGFGMIPLFSILAENCIKDWKLTGAGIAIAILYIYVNAQDRQITTDSLTGLNNRKEFDIYLQRLIGQGAAAFGLLMLDMDDFKWINDNLGHVTGDEALWELADALRRRLGKSKSFLARYGGDEFVVVDMWENEEQVQHVMEEIEDEINMFNKCGKKKYRLSVSIGYALWSEHPGSVEELVALADSRMYERKQAKKKERRGN